MACSPLLSSWLPSPPLAKGPVLTAACCDAEAQVGVRYSEEAARLPVCVGEGAAQTLGVGGLLAALPRWLCDWSSLPESSHLIPAGAGASLGMGRPSHRRLAKGVCPGMPRSPLWKVLRASAVAVLFPKKASLIWGGSEASLESATNSLLCT